MSNLPKIAVKIRAGRLAPTYHAVEALQSVYNLAQYDVPGQEATAAHMQTRGAASSAWPSLYEACHLNRSTDELREFTYNASDPTCFLDDLIGLNYYGAV